MTHVQQDEVVNHFFPIFNVVSYQNQFADVCNIYVNFHATLSRVYARLRQLLELYNINPIARIMLAIESVSLIQFLLLTMSLADVSTVPAEVVARQVKVPVSSSYVVAISSTALLPS